MAIRMGDNCKVFVDQDLCIICGLCNGIARTYFPGMKMIKRKPSVMKFRRIWWKTLRKQWKAAPLKQFNIGTSEAQKTHFREYTWSGLFIYHTF